MDINLLSNNTRSKFTVAQMRDKVRSQMGLVDTNYVSDAFIDDSLVEFQNLLAQDEQWFMFSGTFLTSGNVRYYDMPKDCITLTHVQYDILILHHWELKDILLKWPLALLDNPDGTPAYTASLPYLYNSDGANRLMFFPVPASTSGVLVVYAALPPLPIGDQSLYYWPPYMDTAAIYYGCMRCSLKDMGREGPKRLAAFTAMYEKEYKKAAGRIRGRVADNTIIYGKRNLSSPSAYGPYPIRNYPLP